MTSHTKSFEANKTYSPHVIFILLTFNYRLYGKILAIMFWLFLIDLFRKLNLVLLSFDFSSLASLLLVPFCFSPVPESQSLASFFCSFFISHVISFGYVCHAFCPIENIFFCLYRLLLFRFFFGVTQSDGISMCNTKVHISLFQISHSHSWFFCYRCPLPVVYINV